MGNVKSTTNQSITPSTTIKTKQLKYKELINKYCNDNNLTKEGLQNLFQPLQKASTLFCLYNPNGFEEKEFLILLEKFDNICNDEQQLLFYLNIILNNQDANIKKSAIKLLINVCCDASYLMISYQGKSESNYFDAILQTFDKQDGDIESIHKYFKRNIPNLTRDLHIHLSNCLHESPNKNAIDKSNFQLMLSIESGKSLLSMEGFWIVYSSVPYSYFPLVATSSTPPMNELIVKNGWNCLYQSNQDGLSLNRLNSIISSYKSPTLFFICFDKYIFCIGNDALWRESKDKIGGSDAFLLRLLPDYSLILAGSNIIYYNFATKSIQQGIHIGNSPKSIILKIDADLSFVDYFGVKYSINVLEVWGCGGMEALQNFHKQKQWEKNEALKIQNKKLNLESWEESPDKLILNMAGIETKHNKRD